MKILKNSSPININDRVNHYKKLLKDTRICMIDSLDHTEHISMYIAWKEVGGNIFVKSPLLSSYENEELNKKLSNMEVNNSVLFQTSGTTGLPKIVVHTEQQMNQAALMSEQNMGWDSNTIWLNFLPAFVSGFWHLVIPALVKHNSTVVLGSKQTAIQDLSLDSNLTFLVPAMLDQLKRMNATIDLSKFNMIPTGASQVLRRHAEYVFSNGAKVFGHMYGQTETCSPILGRTTTHLDDFVEYLNLKSVAETESKLVNGELWIRGKSICENYKDFNYEGDWLKTGDMWEQDGDLIKFVGRNNDIVKVNGFQCSLLAIENAAEEKTSLGEVMAKCRNSMGSDWIELYYTNKETKVNKKELYQKFESFIPKYSIPLKYTYIESIPRNSLGKKVRNIL